MKNIFKLITIVVLFKISAAVAEAGTRDGGGGKGVVCRNPDGSIKSVELLDLWEARMVYGRQIRYSEASYEQQLKTLLPKLAWAIPYPVINPAQFQGWLISDLEEHTLDALLKKYPDHFFKTTETVEETKDAYERIVPSGRNGCKIEQIVSMVDVDFSNDRLVYFNFELYGLMDETNKAALNLHEALYSYLRRTMNEPNSVRTRRLVGALMSGVKFNTFDTYYSVLTRFINKDSTYQKNGYYVTDHMICHGPTPKDSAQGRPLNEIYFIKDELGRHDGNVNIYISRLNGKALLGNTVEPFPEAGQYDEFVKKIQEGTFRPNRWVTHQVKSSVAELELGLEFNLDQINITRGQRPGPGEIIIGLENEVSPLLYTLECWLRKARP